MATNPNLIQTQATAPRIQAPTQQADATAQTQDNTADPDNDSSVSDAESASAEGGVNLHRAFAKLQEALTNLADESGVRRVVTVPFQHGQDSAGHISDVAVALQPHDGITANVLSSFHRGGERGWNSGDGSTQAWRADHLRNTIIIKNDPNAIAALDAARGLINKIAGLIGDEDKTITLTKSQIALIGKYNMAGMHVADSFTALNSLVLPPLQAVARLHSTFKHGAHHAKLTAPKPRAKKS